MTDYRRWRVAGGTYFFTVAAYDERDFDEQMELLNSAAVT